MSSNYPPGTGPNDPKAPWNEPDIVTVDCSNCGGGGMVAKLYPSGHTEEKCETCGGTGQIEIEVSDE